MLILTRRCGEAITVTLENGEIIHITILNMHGHQIRIGIDAPRHINIIRDELLRKREQTLKMQSNELNAKRKLIEWNEETQEWHDVEIIEMSPISEF